MQHFIDVAQAHEIHNGSPISRTQNRSIFKQLNIKAF